MSILTREVSQISVFAFPCCMGVIFFFDPHAAWERQKQLLRHLPNEKAIFFIFSTPPQREAQKWYECRFRTIVSVHLGNDAKSKSSLKSAAVPVIFFLTKIVLSKNLINVYRNHSFFQWILTNHTKQCIRIYSNSSKKSCDFASPPLVLTHFRFWRFSMIFICCHN